MKKERYLNPGTFGYMRLYFTTTPRRLITSLWRKLFNLMRYPWNFRQQIRSVWSSRINRAIDSEKTMSTHFMATNEQNNMCFTKPIHLVSEVGGKTYVFVSRFLLLFWS